MKMKSQYEEVLQGIRYAKCCAKRLKLRLENPMAEIEDESISNHDLTQSIVNCFSNAILILSDKPKSEDYQFYDLSSKEYSPPPPLRNHSKKRKINSTNSFENWRDDSPNPYYDRFLWRKYGQKSIKNSNHERSYYRCAYKVDNNCGATKHEQKIKDNPPVYRTTYFGHHTCKLNHNQDAIISDILDPVEDMRNATMIRFGKDPNQEKQIHSGGFSLSVKKEEDIIEKETEDDQDSDITSQDCQHVFEENLSYSHPSSYDNENVVSDADLLLDNPDSWNLYDQFSFDLS